MEDFLLWVLQAGVGVRGIYLQQLAEISTIPTSLYMMLPCTSTSMQPLANSVITSGSPVYRFSKAIKQMATSGLELQTPRLQENHLNLLSHVG